MYEARLELTLDLTLAILDDASPAAPVILETSAEVALAALETASVTILSMAEPGWAITEVATPMLDWTLLTAELILPAIEVRAGMSLGKEC